MQNAEYPGKDEAEIRSLMSRWSAALAARDLDKMFLDYAPHVVLFDAIPPYKVEGVENIKQVWKNCLPYFPQQFSSEHKDVVIHVDGNVAIMHALHHFDSHEKDHPCCQSWLRVTVGYRKLDGQWKVVHEHVSIPFNPMNNQAWQIRDPNVADMPNYNA